MDKIKPLFAATTPPLPFNSVGPMARRQDLDPPRQIHPPCWKAA